MCAVLVTDTYTGHIFDLKCKCWEYYEVMFVCQVSLNNVSISGRLTVRAEVATEAPAPVKVEKISKKQEEGIVVNKFKPKTPYIGRCLLNTKITGDDAPGETWHMVFSTEGECSHAFPLYYFFYIHYSSQGLKLRLHRNLLE